MDLGKIWRSIMSISDNTSGVQDDSVGCEVNDYKIVICLSVYYMNLSTKIAFFCQFIIGIIATRTVHVQHQILSI